MTSFIVILNAYMQWVTKGVQVSPENNGIPNLEGHVGSLVHILVSLVTKSLSLSIDVYSRPY